MMQNSIVFDTSDLPDQEAPESISVVFDTSNLPDVEQGSNPIAAHAGAIPTQDASEVDHDSPDPTPSGHFQDMADLFSLDDTTQVLQQLWNRSRMDAQSRFSGAIPVS